MIGLKKKSKINKGKLVLLGLAGVALVTSLVYDNLKNNENNENNDSISEDEDTPEGFN